MYLKDIIYYKSKVKNPNILFKQNNLMISFFTIIASKNT